MSENKTKGWGFETRKLMGFGRARATHDLINVMQGEESIFGLIPDDLRCDAEQLEVDEKGVVRKSRPQRFTKPKKTTP